MKYLKTQPGAVVKVSVINASFLLNIPTKPYVTPAVPGHDELNVPCFVFLVENPEGRRVLFDLGTRKDWENLPAVALKEISEDGIRIEVERDVVDILNSGGISADDIEAVVLSHHHWDHVGDVSRFPDSTLVVVGPGFINTWLQDDQSDSSKSSLSAVDFRGKKVKEVNFSSDGVVQIGPFKAHDYFGNGSFYLIDAPGHSLGHISALARTSNAPDTFILLGADSCHHNGQLRPSEFRPLPRLIKPHPLHPHASTPCPSSGIKAYLHRIGRTLKTPLYSIPEDPEYEAYTHDRSAAARTIEMMQKMDGFDNVFIVMAHDDSLLSELAFFPLTVNDWKPRDWAEKTRWAFLKDFRSSLEGKSPEAGGHWAKL